MKKIINILVVVFVFLTISGCEKYLDEPKPTDQLTSTAIYSSREGVNAYISGIYRRFRRQYASTTDVGGIYSMYFARSIKGNDLIEKASWYMYDYAHENREPTYRRVRETWAFLYHLVDHANTLIMEVERSPLSDTDKKEFIAHGKALRAYFYLQIAMEYQASYAVDPTLPAPPLYLEPSTEPLGMSTLEDMYALMVQDINDAIADLPETRLGKSYMNKSVAYGIKARILMSMDKDWDQIEAAAVAAYSAYGSTIESVLNPAAYGDGFDDIQSSEWMWGLDQQEDQSNYYYAAPHAFIDHHADGYYATYVNSDFVAQFSATDVRNTFENLYDVTPSNYQYYTTSKFVFSFSSDIPIMRTAEMVLIEAEAKYRQSDEIGAHNVLYALQLNRDPNAIKSTNTGAALYEEILLERRKELYAEMGVEWFDAKRLQRGITRTGNHRVMVTLLPNDKRFYLKIPQAEIDANPFIDASVNDGR